MKHTPEILMVDDNPADIDLTSEVLAQSEAHFHVNAVNDGAEALSFLRRKGKYVKAPVPDLVVLDLNLPRKDGGGYSRISRLTLLWPRFQLSSLPRLRRTPTSPAVTSWEPTVICESREIFRNSSRWSNPWRSSGWASPACPRGRNDEGSIDPRPIDRRQSGRC
jgi:CheY-like chemotaxis protein